MFSGSAMKLNRKYGVHSFMMKKVLQASSNNPKQTFENALAQVGAKGKPIFARNQPIAASSGSGEVVEKRALTDAARALAELWKVSPHLVR